MAGAMRQEDCDTCRHARGGPRASCPRQWEHIACSQAETMETRAAKIRELIRERDHEKSQAEAAYDLAEQYARRAGVDITRDDTLKYVEQYWQQRGNFERDWTALESFRWEVWQLVVQLDEGLLAGPNGEPAPVDALTGRVMAERVRDWLRILMRERLNLADKVKRRPDLFSRPEPPKSSRALQDDLFAGAVQALRDGSGA